jgi:hypothetical protein
MKIAVLDRYNGLDARGLPQRPAHVDDVLIEPPLALPRPAPPDPGPAMEVAGFGG